MSSQFHQEFPSLQAAGESEKGDGQEEEPYGPGPSLRPQSMTTFIHHTSLSVCSLLFNDLNSVFLDCKSNLCLLSC